MVVSAASGPGSAYRASFADTHVYVKNASGRWRRVSNGLPESKGTTISVFATTSREPHGIYAANNRGIFRSPDAGLTWHRLDVRWPERLLKQSVQGLALGT